MKRSLYDILGVDPDSDARTIKSAFRRLAKQYHPDVNPAPDAEERFKRILAAFKVLSDPERRSKYDEGGYAGQHSPRGGYGQDSEGFDEDMGSIFADVFDGRSPMDTSHMQDFGGFDTSIGDGTDLSASVTIDFVTAVRGATRNVTLPGRSFEIEIPPGIEDGQTLRFEARGAPAPGIDGRSGDLLVTVEVEPHPLLSRDGLDLLIDLPITMAEAIKGAKVRLPTPHGDFDVTTPSGVDSGRRLRLEGLGIRTGTQRGDLYAVVRIRTPDRDDDAVREAVETLEDAYSVPVRRDLSID
ncbi:MAG: DnaJ C-terminal domain-containing protein [Myxococcota bacterium]